MTISSTNNRNDYTGNDTTAIYNYSFRVFLESDLTVTVRNTTTDVETELSLTTDYTVQDVGELSGGTITLVDAGQDWISGTSNLDTGYKLTIRRIVGLTQNTDIRNQGDFFPEVHEDVFDRLTMIDQQQQDDLDRAIKLPETIASSEFDTTIPADFVGTQSLALVSNATGDGFATGPSISAIEGAQAAATAAAASAAAAATSETNAGTSETNAATSETNAATSETNAAASAAAASTSETNAATSASNAATSETNAGTSETNAAASAAAASTSETNAATSASNAATSASNAATSASNAATSETNAATSATNAATSEANAAASATAAQDAAAASQWKDVVYITNVDSPVSITDADSGKLYSVNTSGGNVVFNLPAISGLTLSAPWSIGVKKTDISANTVTINPNGTDVIDGNASATISQAETGLVVIPDADPAPDEWTTLIFGEVPSVFEGKTFNDEITMKEIATPSAPAAGFQAIFMDSGDNKLKRIDSNGDVFGVGGGAGDADTIHLIKASDQGAAQITQYSVDSVLPDFDGTSAFGANEGDISVPTSGSEALLSNDDDHKVYKYTAESASQYSAYGMNLDMPRYVRGEDVVLQFKYRTADTSGDSQNADYMPWVYDQTNGVNTTFNDTPGTFAAGSSIILTTTAGMAVGDKIWVGEAAGVVETHITAIPVAGTVQLADEVTCAAGARFITGILTDVLTTLDAADDDTDKTGTDYKVVFNVPSDCAQVTVMFQQLTSQTDSFLYVDNILISSEVVKRVFARDRAEYHGCTMYTANFWDAATSGTSTFDISLVDLSNSKYLRWDDTTQTRLVAKQRIKLDIATQVRLGYAGQIYIQNSSNESLAVNNGDRTSDNSDAFVSASLILEKDDYVFIKFDGTAANRLGGIQIVATPEVNDVVIVESADSSNYLVRGEGNGGGSVTADVTAIDFTEVEDTKSIWDGSTLIPTVTGDYSITGCIGATSSHAGTMQLFEDGTLYKLLATNSVSASIKTFSGTVRLTAGNSYDFRASLGFTLSNTTHSHWIQIHKIKDADDYQPLLAFPTITYGQDAEYAAYDAVGGYGSTNTKIPYFSTEIANTISNFGTVDYNNTTSGFSFTASRRCKVQMSVNTYFSSASSLGITLNSSQLTTNIDTVTGSTRLSHQGGVSGAQCTTNVILDAGDVLRPHTNGVSISGVASLTLLVEPEEGQVNQAAIISQPVAYCRFDGQSADVPVGSNTTITLDKLDGDIAAVGVTLSSNDFTLPAGRYEVEWSMGMWVNGTGESVGSCQLYNVTDSVVQQNGLAACGDGNNYGTLAPSTGSTVFTITKDTTFRIRGNNIRNSGSHTLYVGWGSTNANVDKGYVKITRKK